MSLCLAFPICGTMTAALMATAGKKGRGELLWIRAGKKLLLNKETVQTIRPNPALKYAGMAHRIAPVYKRVSLAIAKGKRQRGASGASTGEGTTPAPHACTLSADSRTLPQRPPVPVAAARRTGKDKVRGKRKDGALLHLLSL